MKISIKRTSDRFNDLELPKFQTAGSVGADLRAAIDKTLFINPTGFAVIPTGISIELPAGYEAQVRGRSGLAAKRGLFMLNGVGTIDSDYRGEICCILANFTSEFREIKRGDRIGQLVINKIVIPQFVEVTELSDSDRGAGGFGSTGSK